jgi:hypothetical protein
LLGQEGKMMEASWERTAVVYGFLFGIGVLGALSDVVLNQWARTNRWPWLLAAYFSWGMVATLLGLILRWQYFSFSGAVVLFLLVNSAGAILLDYQLLGRRLTTWECVGIAFAIVAMCCIEMGRADSHAPEHGGAAEMRQKE